MRVSFLLAGLISAAAAVTITVTATTDITVTSCTPSVTNCPAQSGSPSAWDNVSIQPAPTVTATSEWQQWSSAAAPCPAYTATAPPAWFSMLPESAYSSVAAKWTGGPPADWCYYSYSSTAIKTAPAVYSTTAAPVVTGGYKPSTTSAYAQYTGAANSNAGPVGLAGLAVAALLVLA